MKIYSDYPLRRTLQIFTDVLALIVLSLAVWLGIVVSASIAALAEVGRQLESAGAGFKGAMTDAGEALGQVPFVGTAIRAPFDSASGTGSAIENAGHMTESFIESAAMIVGLTVAGVIIVIVCWFWLSRRVRFIRRATEAHRLAGLEDGADILALRALVHASRKELSIVSSHPVQGWRSGDGIIVTMLAELELREAGVRIAR